MFEADKLHSIVFKETNMVKESKRTYYYSRER
jgi:hypothetical protein